MSAESHQNAGFSIWVFKNFPGGNTPGPPQREGATPSRTHPLPGLWLGAGRKRPGVGTQTLVPLNFSAVVAPLPVMHARGCHNGDFVCFDFICPLHTCNFCFEKSCLWTGDCHYFLESALIFYIGLHYIVLVSH